MLRSKGVIGRMQNKRRRCLRRRYRRPPVSATDTRGHTHRYIRYGSTVGGRGGRGEWVGGRCVGTRVCVCVCSRVCAREPAADRYAVSTQAPPGPMAVRAGGGGGDGHAPATRQPLCCCSSPSRPCALQLPSSQPAS